MNFILDESQQMLAQAAREFFDSHADIERIRRYRDEDDPTGFSWDLWREMGQLGFPGAQIPEEFGGLALKCTDAVLIFEAAGRHLLPEPMLSSLLGIQCLLAGGSPEQRADWFPGIAAGERLLTLADREQPAPYAPHRIHTRAEPVGTGYRLTGRKCHVIDGHAAHGWVIPARTDGSATDTDGVTLFLVPRGTDGVEVRRLCRIDGRGAADLVLDGVEVDTGAILGTVGEGSPILDSILDRGRIALAAEMLGAADRALDITLLYLKERHQFGAPIGSFQALQHRAARMFMSVTLARSAVAGAARVMDEDSGNHRRAASLAKAQAGAALLHVAKEGIQMHGGVGVTDEFDIGFYLKRGQVAEATLGNGNWHRDRWAALGEY